MSSKKSNPSNLPTAASPTALDIFRDYPKEKYNLLIPSRSFGEVILPHHKVMIETVELNPDPEKNEVYVQEWEGSGNTRKPKKVAPTKVGLERLGIAANIIIDPRLSGLIVDTADRIVFKSVGHLKKPDGTFISRTRNRSIDLRVLREKFIRAYTKKADDFKQWLPPVDNPSGWKVQRMLRPDERDGWIEEHVERDLLQKREFILELAETGANNRVIRALLAIASSYSPEDIGKPFVVPRLVFCPDSSDPVVSQQVLEAGLKSQGRMYPGGGQEIDAEYSLSPPAGQEIQQAEEIGEKISEIEDQAGLNREELEQILGPDENIEEPVSEEQRAEMEKEHRILIIKEQFCPDEIKSKIIEIGQNSPQYDFKSDPDGIVGKFKEGNEAEALYMIEQWRKENPKKEESNG